MGTKQKMIPWLNEGLKGFFECELHYKEHFIFARNREDVQAFFTHDIKHKNHNKINTEVNKILDEQWNNYSLEERQAWGNYTIFYTESRDKLWEETENRLMQEGILDPYDLTIDSEGVEIIEHIVSAEDIADLDMITSNLNVTQKDLEDIYYFKETNNQEYIDFMQALENAINFTNLENSNTDMLSTICELYENNLSIQDEIVANAEVLVELYEQINS